jgi:hypothetical protein
MKEMDDRLRWRISSPFSQKEWHSLPVRDMEAFSKSGAPYIWAGDPGDQIKLKNKSSQNRFK